MKRWSFLVAMLPWLAGCYHYRASAVNLAPATEPQSVTVWTYAWGAVQQDVQPTDCANQALQQVEVSSNFGFALLTVVSLGFVSPATVEWRCAKSPVVPAPHL
jgi:hypothetical protein